MNNKFEKFEIGGRWYVIQKADQKFNVWLGGCRIACSEDMDAARKVIFMRATESALMAIENGKKMMEEAQREYDLLCADPFNLGRFLV